jgi:hypothetical protein
MTADALGTAYSERWQRAEHLLKRRGAGTTAVVDIDDPEAFEGIIKESYGEDEERKLHPVRRRVRALLTSRGVRGATPKWLMDRLAVEDLMEGRDYARETLQRWLREDKEAGLVHSGEFGLWIIGPED